MILMRQRIITLTVGIIIIGFVLAYITLRAYTQSLYHNTLTRVNIGIWGKHSYVLSLGKTSRQHYIFLFANSYEVEVPGGLKKYKIGALGKLAGLEKDPQLFAKAMGQGGGVFIHKHLYDDTQEIFYDDSWVDSLSFTDIKTELMLSIFRAGELNVFDRLFVLMTIRDARPGQTTLVRVKTSVPQLLLYEKSFRNEKKLVQILYSGSQHTAIFISKMLENTGIRVADITQNPKRQSGCSIIESSGRFSQTASFLSSYFGCALEKGETGLYEIIWLLDQGVEDTWQI